MENYKVLIIDSDTATQKWLRNLLSGHGYSVVAAQSGKEGLTKAMVEAPDLVILDLDLMDMAGEVLIESIAQDSDLNNKPIIVFSSRHDLLEISRLFQMGIADYVTKRPGIENELLGKLTSSMIRARSGEGLKPKGKLISFFSAKGGNGTSTLCLNLAHCLAEQIKPKSVLVVDLVLPLGSIAIMTGVEHEDSVANLTAEVKPHDTQKLRQYLLPVDDWAVSILPGSESVEDSHKLIPERIVPILYSLLRAFDYVFVDLGKTLSSISQSVLNYSDAIAVVVGTDVLTAELTQIALKYLAEIGIEQEKIFLILNRAVGLEGLTKMEVEERIGQPIQRTVRYARENFTLATNRHMPYAGQYPNDALTMELEELAEMLRQFAQTGKRPEG